MAIDTPATLAILGAGPIGLEAALYARFLGYAVVIYERGQVAQSVLDIAAVPLPWPFQDCHTPLGLAAVQAQDEGFQSPAPDAILTFGEWRERYLLPLANSDLLGDHLRLQTTVLQVEVIQNETDPTAAPLRDDEADPEPPCPPTLRVIANGSDEQIVRDDYAAVLDCTGQVSNPTWRAIDSPAQGSAPEPSATQPAPNLYVLGSKTSTRSDFPLAAGYAQIRDVFKIIGDRATLDLYATSARLLR